MSFWDRLEKALFDNHLNIATLSKKLEISQPSISHWKRGAIPRADIAVKMANILGTTVEYLISGVQKVDLTEINEDSKFLSKLHALSAVNQNAVITLLNSLYNQELEINSKIS